MFLVLLSLPAVLLWQADLAITAESRTVQRERSMREATQLFAHELDSPCGGAMDGGARVIDSLLYTGGLVVGRRGRANPFARDGMRTHESWSRRCSVLLAPQTAQAAASADLDLRDRQYRSPWERMVVAGEMHRDGVQITGETFAVAAGVFAAASALLVQQSRIYAGGQMHVGLRGTSVDPLVGPITGYGLRLVLNLF